MSLVGANRRHRRRACDQCRGGRATKVQPGRILKRSLYPPRLGLPLLLATITRRAAQNAQAARLLLARRTARAAVPADPTRDQLAAQVSLMPDLRLLPSVLLSLARREHEPRLFRCHRSARRYTASSLLCQQATATLLRRSPPQSHHQRPRLSLALAPCCHRLHPRP